MSKTMTLLNCTVDPNGNIMSLLLQTKRYWHGFRQRIYEEELLPTNQHLPWFPLRISITDYAILLLFIYFWKHSRFLFTNNIGNAYCTKMKVMNKYQDRIKESLWNLLIDFCMWIWVIRLSQENKNQCNLLLNPSRLFDNLEHRTNIPFEPKLFYLANMSKYCFNLYAVLYLDEKRRDFPVMVMHHLVTLWLLSLSYVPRAWEAGVLVIAIHDLVDIFMLSSKILLNSKREDGQISKCVSFFTHFFALLFVFSWISMRLYLYPFRVIYYLSFLPLNSPDTRLMGMAFILLWAILLMDIYWTYYILKFIWRLVVVEGIIVDTITESKLKNKKSD